MIDDPRVLDAVAMREQGKSLRQIAERLGVTAPTVHRWTKGITTPRKREAVDLAAEIAERRVVALDDAPAEVTRHLQTTEIARLITELEATRTTGRPGAPVRTMVGMVLVKGLCNIPKWTAVLSAVGEHGDLRAALGINGTMPSEWACYRFAEKVRGHQAILDECFERPRREAREKREAARVRAFERVRATLEAGLPPHWHPSTPESRTLSADEQAELARLTAQQEKDERWEDRVSRPKHVVSLDDEVRGEDGEFAGDSLAGPEHMDPAVLLTTTTDYHLRDVIGDVTADVVASMGEWTRMRLQERVLAAGFAVPSVQHKERERLREPVRHRGDAPAPTWEPMSPRHRNRKSRMARKPGGKRTSRKPRKRWERAA